MAYFPLFVDLTNKKCLVVGGGKVAWRKARAMADYGASVTVIAEAACSQMEEFGKQEGRLLLRKAEPRDAEGADLVICASDDHRLHQEIFAFCQERQIPVNTADDKELCSFYFPALVRQKDVVVGISTGGQSPAAARYLREQVEEMMPPFFGDLAEKLGKLRPAVMERVENQKEREAVFRKLLEESLENEGNLTGLEGEGNLTGMDGVVCDGEGNRFGLEGKGNLTGMDGNGCDCVGKRTLTLRIGTRESELALAQTRLAAQAMEAATPGIKTQLCTRQTLGDRILDQPLLSFGGKGVFVSAFEEALQKDELDFAVHSAKDLPASLAEGLEIVSVLPAEDARDVLVMAKGREIKEEGKGDRKESGKGEEKEEDQECIRIGTSSLRRTLQIEELGKKLWPGRKVVCESLRGNVLTRLNRLENGDFDGIILAAAGLKRLDIEDARPGRYTCRYFSLEEMIPAGGQGILAIEARKGNPVNGAARRVCHRETWIRFAAERRVLEVLEAGCHEPVGVHCRVELEDGRHVEIAETAESADTGTGALSFKGRLFLDGILKREETVRRAHTAISFSGQEGAEAAARQAADRLADMLLGKDAEKEMAKGTSGTGFVWLVGAGPGDPGLITVKGAQLLESCDCIVYDHLVEKRLLERRKEGCELLFVGKEKGRHSMAQEQINELLIEKAREGRKVVRLKGGDPFVFGRGGEEAMALNAAGIPWQVVPGVTSAVAAPAAAGIPITHRQVSRSFHVITGHTKKDGGLPEDFNHLGQCGGTLVFLMGLSHLEEIAQGLLAQGMRADMPAAVIQEGTLPGQRTVRGTLADIAGKVREAGLKAPAVILVGETAGICLASGGEAAGKGLDSGNQPTCARQTGEPPIHESLAGAWGIPEYMPPIRRQDFQSKPLNGMQIGVTGTNYMIDRLRPLLENLGARVKVLCSLKIISINQEALEESCRRLNEFTWLAFTSANGVRRFLDCLCGLMDGKRRLDLRSLAHLRLAAVGRGTAEELARHGLFCDYIPEKFHTKELAQGLAEFLGPEDRVLIPRALQGSPELGEILSAAGVDFQELPVYDVESCGCIDDGGIAGASAGDNGNAMSSAPSASTLSVNTTSTPLDAAVFASASGVRAFFAGGSRALLAGIPVICIGETCGAALAAQGIALAAVAKEATAEGLADAVVRCFGKSVQ